MYALVYLQKFYRNDKFLGIGKFSLLALLIYSIILGCRYNVGVDYAGYLGYYEQITKFNGANDRFEYLFALISWSFSDANLHYSIYFTFWAFLQIYLLFLSVKNERYIYPSLVFSLIIGCFFLTYMNGIRQMTSFCILAYSLKYIIQENWKKYILAIIIAFLIHKSAIIVFPLYFIFNFKNEYFKSIKVQIVMLAISLILLILNFNDKILYIIEKITSLINYGKYASAMRNGTLEIIAMKRERGVGFFVILILNIYLILMSRKVKKYVSNKKYNIMYDLYFIGVLWFYLFNGSLILNRPNYYFYSFRLFVVSFTLFYVFKTKNILLISFNIFLVFMLFAAIMYRMEENTSLFTFFWQN